MEQAQQKRRAVLIVLIVEDDAELRSLTAALLEDEQLDTIECESAEAALATLLIGGREVAMIFASYLLAGRCWQASTIEARRARLHSISPSPSATTRLVKSVRCGPANR